MSSKQTDNETGKGLFDSVCKLLIMSKTSSSCSLQTDQRLLLGLPRGIRSSSSIVDKTKHSSEHVGRYNLQSLHVLDFSSDATNTGTVATILVDIEGIMSTLLNASSL